MTVNPQIYSELSIPIFFLFSIYVSYAEVASRSFIKNLLTMSLIFFSKGSQYSYEKVAKSRILRKENEKNSKTFMAYSIGIGIFVI